MYGQWMPQPKNTKLTLTIEQTVIEKAKKYAKDKERSLSNLIENYLKALTKESDSNEIELTPIDKSKLFHKVVVFINKAAKTITSTKIFEKAGNRYTYTVSGMNTTVNIADATFIFNQKNYPGMELVDLR